MPLYRRVPKFGFKNINRIEYKPLNLSVLQDWIERGRIKDYVDVDILYDYKFIQKNDKVKLLAKGEIKAPITVKVHKASKKAVEAIEKAGGKVELI